MARIHPATYLRESVENYYQLNPDTLMPLLMLTLAAQGRLGIGTGGSEGHGTVFASLDLSEIQDFEWVRKDTALKKRVRQALAGGVSTFSVTGDIPQELGSVYDTFYKYDNVTVEQEYHHRIGILHHHSSDEASEKALRQYAAFCLAEAMLNIQEVWLKESFLKVANHILVKSGLQPERPRMRVGEALSALLEYDGRGKVYNPFAGCAIAAAMVDAGENLVVDGDTNDKILAAARLITYGKSGKMADVELRDSSKWENGDADYILSTYRGYVQGSSAFDFCLGRCLDTPGWRGKYAGIVAPKDIFEKRSPEMKEALRRDWVEAIALLPFGEVAVLINASKTVYRNTVRLFDVTHPMLSRRDFCDVFNSFSHLVKTSDARKKGFLRSFYTPEIEQRDGYELARLGDFVGALPKRTYSLSSIPEQECVLAYIDKSEGYDEFGIPWMNAIEKHPINVLFTPAYRLDRDCLIVNSCGDLQPRLFDADQGTAYFQDGLAFSLNSPWDVQWLIRELNQPYVMRQLHPYGYDELVPEKFSESQVLDLKLYIPSADASEGEAPETDADRLPAGTTLHGRNIEYTIHRFLGNGSFGFAYSALSHDLMTGEQKEVVLKEFYPCNDFHREGLKAVQNMYAGFDIDAARDKFREEARIMNLLGGTRDSHIVPAFEIFSSPETDTLYYSMPFFHDGSLEDLMNSGFEFTEELAVKHVVVPLCKALAVAHSHKVLHLDIKPENILVDENGDAVLTDFGTAKQYDEAGVILNRNGVHGCSCEFAAPEVRQIPPQGTMIRFGSQPDIYSLAATLYLLVTKEPAHPIVFNSDQDEDLLMTMTACGCSDRFAHAITAGLQDSAGSRPATPQAFLNLFPGCEAIKL